MILLEKGNRILFEQCNSMIIREDEEEGKEAKSFTPCDINLQEFDDVSYNVKVDASDTNSLIIAMNLPIYSDIANKGGEDAAKEHFGEMLQPCDGDPNTVTIKVDFATCCGLTEEKKEELCKNISQMKNHVVGGAFNYYFKALNDKAPKTGENAEYRVRGDTTLYLVPGDDRVVVIYELNFDDDVDKCVSKVFLDIFAGTKTSGSPPCKFSQDPPTELQQHFGIKENNGCLGYVSFSVLTRHVTDKQRDKVIHVLQTFRAFLQYHLKMSKSFWHSKMRARCVSLQKVLNRAKVADPEEQKKKKTASGKTFKR